MPTTQTIKKEKKLTVTGRAKKIKTTKKARLAGAQQKTKTTAEVNPILKSKEWKLLYMPYPFRTTNNSNSPMSNMQISSHAKRRNSGQYKGLCGNCKKRKNCSLPKPEGGVWRCEEYE